MDKNIEEFRAKLSFLGNRLIDDILESAIIKEFPGSTEIVSEGQYIRAVPIVLSGLIKVYSRYEDKELLLYYIEPYQSCIMSFSSALADEPSRIFATTEEDTEALLLPVERVRAWIVQFPEINTLFFNQYNIRYHELLETIRQLLYDKLDKRIYDYLVEKCRVKGTESIEIRHKQIALEIGTAREVVSRIMKKFEKEGRIRQEEGVITML
jgi:CRP/FNR family transcriptional regulator